jgi:hypothetical protein
MDTIGLPNASWWENTSTVVVKEDYLAQDEAWVNKQMVSLNVKGNQPNMQMTGDRNILIVQRMVQPGSVVAVKRANGRIKTVELPKDAGQLLIADLMYLVNQIDALNTPPMTTEEQEAFLPGATGQSEANSGTES